MANAPPRPETGRVAVPQAQNTPRYCSGNGSAAAGKRKPQWPGRRTLKADSWPPSAAPPVIGCRICQTTIARSRRFSIGNRVAAGPENVVHVAREGHGNRRVTAACWGLDNELASSYCRRLCDPTQLDTMPRRSASPACAMADSPGIAASLPPSSRWPVPRWSAAPSAQQPGSRMAAAPPPSLRYGVTRRRDRTGRGVAQPPAALLVGTVPGGLRPSRAWRLATRRSRQNVKMFLHRPL